ncbi:60S ribosomal protein L13 [Plasmodiophora brassicae]|uniref:60S ribosomal protein L13 n=1 Tax=Plasmodiophora brassicae TaxID=37360 RepID=A0A0G4J391_PLABS|nr:hypothetical protein PBRA_002262 [Plasmodiophora brassicae]SPQ98854.1 unnamed protein product [Plasmodiophora brassicae]
MVKHNNVVPNQHFRKDWDCYVRTWFNQPAKKVARRAHRAAKAAKLAPRPVNLLRPAVRGQTLKYNAKIRMGRGFTLDELKAVGISKKAARGIGIAVDHRRRNRSQEGFDINIQRLRSYKAKLIVFPRKANKMKKGDSSKEDQGKAKQVTEKSVLPIAKSKSLPKARAITAEERDVSAFALMKKERMTAKLWGQRAKRAKDKLDAENAKKGK